MDWNQLKQKQIMQLQQRVKDLVLENNEFKKDWIEATATADAEKWELKTTFEGKLKDWVWEVEIMRTNYNNDIATLKEENKDLKEWVQMCNEEIERIKQESDRYKGESWNWEWALWWEREWKWVWLTDLWN